MNIGKLKEAFPQTTVFKDQGLIATFKSANIPAFLRDWILKRKADADGHVRNPNELRKYIDTIIPRKDQKLVIYGEAQQAGATRKFLANIRIQFNISQNKYTFEIPDLDIRHSETMIEPYVWERIRADVEKTSGGWGLVQLGYLPPDDTRPKGQRNGFLNLLEYKNFCPYTVNVDAYRKARELFTIEEWMDVLLGAIDYNPDGYSDWVQKHTMLSRLLPFIEPRINLVELAPKGTGKSYLFGTVGKYGWLVSGGTLSRAKMFYDAAKKQNGLVATNEFVALDEIQSIQFPDPSEMQGALKAYMEQGFATFGDVRVTGSAGVILLGNIPAEDMNEQTDMFRTLPEGFHESALLDRFHGFIKGRNIPRMSENLKINNWALNTEYFSEIMHLMRTPAECLLYRSVVEELIDFPSGADTRDTEAVMRICTAYLKLLFPNAISPDKINPKEFVFYCLRPAIEMRTVIRQQLQIIDPKEYGKKNMATYQIKQKYLNAGLA